jgi:hypothetical protein
MEGKQPKGKEKSIMTHYLLGKSLPSDPLKLFKNIKD